MPRAKPLAEDELVALFGELSNRGRLGDNDQLGTLNYVTPAKVAQAASLVRSGRLVSIAHDVGLTASRKNRSPATLRMLYQGRDTFMAIDEFTIIAHGFCETHLDALGHQFFEGQIYNGRDVDEVVRPAGLAACDIRAVRNGIVTRGVLLDVPQSRGVRWLTADDEVTVSDLEAASALVEGGVQSGDALFVRVGLGAREAVEGTEDHRRRAGLTPDCLRWLHENEVAVYSGDCFEKVPLGYPRVPMPLHQIGSVAMGLYLLDHADMESLLEACEQEGRSEFLVTIAPLRIKGGTGSAVNPICVF